LQSVVLDESTCELHVTPCLPCGDSDSGVDIVEVELWTILAAMDVRAQIICQLNCICLFDLAFIYDYSSECELHVFSQNLGMLNMRLAKLGDILFKGVLEPILHDMQIEVVIGELVSTSSQHRKAVLSWRSHEYQVPACALSVRSLTSFQLLFSHLENWITSTTHWQLLCL
jgi:hypothetical protein